MRFLNPVRQVLSTRAAQLGARRGITLQLSARVAQQQLQHVGWNRSFATIGKDGTDSDFAPKKKDPPPSGRDVQTEIKEGVPDQPMCGFSNRAIQILDHHRAIYGAFNVLQDAEVREGIKKFSNWPTIPQLFVNGEFIGGCDIMMEMHQSGELKTLLENSGSLQK